MKLLYLAGLFFVSIFYLNAQIVDGDDIKYGNEWIGFDKDYYKIPIFEDGIYHITYQTMKNAGIDVDNISGKDFQLFVYGKEVPVYTSTNDKFGTNDYIEFYGEKNRSQLDYYLFRDKTHLFNPDYSLYTDTASYFLTWDNSKTNNRFMPLNNDLSGNLPLVEKYYYHEEKSVFNSDFHKPLRDSENHVYRSNFDIGEGYGSPMKQKNSFTLKTSNIYNDGQNAELKVRLTTNAGKHNIDMLLDNKLIKKISKEGFICEEFNVPLLLDDLSSSMDLIIQGNDNSDFYDKNAVSEIVLKYTREFNFLNKDFFRFKIKASNFQKYFEITDFDLTGDQFVIYDLKNNTRLIPEIDKDNKIVKFLLPPSNTERDLILVNISKTIKQVDNLLPLKFHNFLQDKDKDYIIITKKDAFIDDNQTDWITEYDNYRSSVEGGSFKTLVVDVQDIYDQFGYGINRHAQGMNDFILFIKKYFDSPKYIFLIGKGLEYNEIRTNTQLNDPLNTFFVPTYGYPGSDNLLAAEFNKNYPIMPIGRIAAKTWQQVRNYLNKVKSHENYQKYSQNIDDKMWMKKVIHLVGGSPDIINGIRSSLKVMGNIISNNKFGAYVHTYERSSGTSQESVTQLITDDIEDGAGIVTFYGHSGVTGGDFNIASIQSDRYPVFFSLGCYSGNIHTSILSGQSERFVLDEKGVVVYAGTSGTGFTGVLAQLGKNIYTLAGTEYYGHGMGEIVQKAIEINGNNTGDASITLNQQFTYHGDPAVSLYVHPGPDYTIDYSSVYTNPAVINSNSDDFEINFDVINLGYKVSDSLIIKLLRKLPGGSIDTLYQKIASPGAKKTVAFKLKTHYTSGIGENCISVYVDPQNQIEELPAPDAENNNQLSDQNGENKYCFYIINNGAKPVYPSEFSIVNKQDIELQASTYNYFVEPNKYIFQIDTTELFNSPLLKTNEVKSKGGLVSWKPGINLEHNTVYYWRISPDSISPSSPFLWASSSFIYLENSSEGWNQSHYYQYLKDESNGISINKKREFVFDLNPKGIRLIGKKYDPNNRIIAFVNGEAFASFNPINHRPCLTIIGIGPKKYFKNPNGNYGNIQGVSPYTWCFKMNSIENRVGIKNLLNDMPDSATVLIYTVLDDGSIGLFPEEWEQDSVEVGYNIFGVLESYGAEKIRLMKTRGTVPYIFVFKKGDGVIFEQIGKTLNSKFEASFVAYNTFPNGKFVSTIIGPVKKWNKLLWKESNKLSDDLSYLKIYKFDNGLNQSPEIDSLNSIYEYDLNNLDASQYPYIKFELFSEDKQDKSPPNLDFWRVLYQELPDAVLVNNEESYFYKDTLFFGDKFKFKTKVFNNSSTDMDSLLVRFKIKKQNNDEIVVDKKYAPLAANSFYFIDFEYSTNELQGVNEFTVEVNPDRTQKEKYYFNNVGIKRFFVGMDNENPLLDVTFDSEHIMDGDIISPKPEINIMLKDDNKFLLLNDISIFKKLSIVTPSGNIIEEPIENNNKLEFIPAESVENNKAQLIYKPEFTEEGEYRMTVQATDMSGNLSGDNEYKISFRVILKEQISNVYNYPNPFSNKTRFIFTLTGTDVPENIVIRIMTLSGKVVRELTNIDLGDMKIGKNITKKYWDGTDEFGSKLANGIYLYEVKAVNAAGKEFDLMETGDNDKKYFKQGFGKLVILR